MFCCALLRRSFAKAQSQSFHRFVILFGLTHLLTLRLERERRSIANPICIATISTLFLHSALARTLIKIGIPEKRGLCVVPLLAPTLKLRRKRLERPGEVHSPLHHSLRFLFFCFLHN